MVPTSYTMALSFFVKFIVPSILVFASENSEKKVEYNLFREGCRTLNTTLRDVHKLFRNDVFPLDFWETDMCTAINCLNTSEIVFMGELSSIKLVNFHFLPVISAFC